jgi:poly(hydroxyalkanoate) depolymerase family esterase
VKNPFSGLIKAARRVRQGLPLSSARAMHRMIKSAKPIAKRTARPRPAKAARRAAIARPEASRPAAGSFVDGRFSCAQGSLAYKLYTPTGSTRRRLPLVVMLHGCTQTAADFAAGTKMNRLADEIGLLVLYPEQSIAASLGRCWNWHRPGDQRRGSGEPAVIAALTRHAIALCRADAARVYIAGISAGGAAAAIVAAAYPELFAAACVHSGLARGTIATLGEALAAMRNGISASAVDDGTPGRIVPTIVFHGDRDRIVHPSNAGGFLAQLRRSSAGPIAGETDRGCSAGGRDFTRTRYRQGRGAVLLEDWTIHGTGHAWSGGSPAGSHTDPAGPDASREMVRFFLARRHGRVTVTRPSAA